MLHVALVLYVALVIVSFFYAWLRHFDLLGSIWIAALSQPWDGLAYWMWPRLLESSDSALSGIDDDYLAAGEVVALAVFGVLNASLLWGLRGASKKYGV